MGATARAACTDAFVARNTAPDRSVVDRPGMHGLTSVADVSAVHLLVTDDRALDDLAALLPTVRTGRVDVFAEAPRCLELVHRELGWGSTSSTAMACPDLSVVPEPVLTDELTLRPVRRTADDAADGVPLEEAMAVALSADPTTDESPAALTAHVRAFPFDVRIFAAVDRSGTARATAGVGVLGAQAIVLLVSTHPAWRRRGTGRAMTATALHAARAAGAEQACLDASEIGISTYRRLGFETVARTTRFSRPA